MPPPRDALRLDLLHLLGLTLLAVAQPLFAVLGEQATFFTAHRADRPAVLLWTAAVSLGPWLAMTLLEVAAAPLPRLRALLHPALLAGLATLALLPLAHRLLSAHPVSGALAAAGTGALFGVAYSRLSAVRLFTTFAAWGSLALPLVFLATTPAARSHAAPAAGTEAPPARTPHPIVMVVFDELSLASLLTGTETIDRHRFPHFAALADTSDWYINAGAVADGTSNALPSLLDGRYPRDARRIPVHAEFPQNLFTLLAGSYRLNVHETITWLCPAELCAQPELRRGAVLASLLFDSAVVYGHVVSPAPLRRRLPTIAQGWTTFRDPTPVSDAPRTASAWLQAAVGGMDDDRRALFRRFVASIPDGGRPSLSFLHVLLPHIPYMYLPSSRSYDAAPLRGLRRDTEAWAEDEVTTREGYQRYLLQVGFVDAMIGELVDELRRDGTFDRTLLVVTADHGVAFRPGANRRALSRENAGEIVPVPLFIKRPQQRRGTVRRAACELIDVLPTLAELAGVEVPWRVEGASLLGPPRPLRSRRLFTWRGEVLDLPVDLGLRGVVERRRAVFGTGREPRRLFSLGLADGLVGRPVSALAQGGGAGARVVVRRGRAGGAAGAEPVPVRLSGEVSTIGELRSPLDLAVAVDGRIAALARTYREGGRELWSAMLPEGVLVPGASIDVLLLRRSATGAVELLAMETDAPASERLLAGSRGEAAARRPPPLREGLLRGWTETVRVEPTGVHFIGWAADVEHRRPAAEVVLLVGDRPLQWELPNRDRPDVGTYFGIEPLRYSGYILTVRAGELAGAHPEEVRVLGFTAAGEAQRLAMTPEAACALARLWWEGRGRESAWTEPLDDLPPARGTGPAGQGEEPILAGAVDGAEEVGSCLRLRGWAVETAARRPPRRLLVADRNRVVFTGTPAVPRPDITAQLGGGEALRCGFELIVPLEAFEGPWQRDLRLVAEGGGRRARLPFVGGRPARPAGGTP